MGNSVIITFDDQLIIIDGRIRMVLQPIEERPVDPGDCPERDEGISGKIEAAAPVETKVVLCLKASAAATECAFEYRNRIMVFVTQLMHRGVPPFAHMKQHGQLFTGICNFYES